ncbi:hypothetical protein HCA61_01820 [Rhodococcus sp. HNM0563]|uniref:hypothetical protein n=1 Tax=unclassified Rhodococcus (in: high G+C Gram-positive bacteria) TaxID=192944 RepID=UPI00146E0429|nr:MULTISPECIES: hypothetical protein [unclassified Rhodococcus (in: high G+C Gram-positive bacteria)]MCK0090956.1 hypothetical protein [Rhodococcus sp. F64268]NLU61002.1 hypothetical protein [Rhodococcus sp. HNM0563]
MESCRLDILPAEGTDGMSIGHHHSSRDPARFPRQQLLMWEADDRAGRFSPE